MDRPVISPFGEFENLFARPTGCPDSYDRNLVNPTIPQSFAHSRFKLPTPTKANETTMTTNIRISEGSRIPADLQAVFIAASLGQEIEEPPPKAASFKYYLSWIWDLTGGLDSVSSLDNSVKVAEPVKSKTLKKTSKTKSGEKKGLFKGWKSSSKQTKTSRKQKDAKTNTPIPITVRPMDSSKLTTQTRSFNIYTSPNRVSSQNKSRPKRISRAFFAIVVTPLSHSLLSIQRTTMTQLQSRKPVMDHIW